MPPLLLGGQVHNSSPSSPAHMAPIWERMRALHAGTVIGAAAWDLVEPEEGRFDFATVDAQVEGARERGIALVLIWFGAFKNAASTYAPRWVREDGRRFPRAALAGRSRPLFTYPGAMPKPVLSPFSTELRDADERAFVALARHLAEVDVDGTVVMLQVENEVGVLGDSRDRSPAAEETWQGPVPAALLDALAANPARLHPSVVAAWRAAGGAVSGGWAEVFGTTTAADEVFMSWGFGTYLEQLAAAAKAVLPVPMYANAWLGPQAGQPEPGDYPSGGPVAHLLDVWKIAAPSLDLLAPDIYVEGDKAVLAQYARDDNPLFVPESLPRVGTLFAALGAHSAIGFSVFGVEDVRVDGRLARAYELLGALAPAIVAAQAEGRIAGILLDDGETEAEVVLGGYTVVARDSAALIGRMLLDAGLAPPPAPAAADSEVVGGHSAGSPGDDRPCGIVIDEGDGIFVAVGQRLNLDLVKAGTTVELDRLIELDVASGVLVERRALNGDERLMTLPPGAVTAVRLRVLDRAS